VELRGKHVILRELEPTHVGPLLAIVAKPEVAGWWGSIPEGFPLEDEPEATRLTIFANDEIAGMIQFTEESDPDYRHAWIDIFLDPALHHRGVGVDTGTTLKRHLLEQRGHHRITTDPAPDNLAAIRLCEKLGFRRVGVMHACWRDSAQGSWRDSLLMELVKLPALEG